MPKTCIVCGEPSGSGEHIFPACLGGLRVNNGIYCGPHNNDYGPLAAQLREQLGFFNANFGIRNSRTKQVQSVTLTDPKTGATFDYDGENLKPTGPRLLSQNGNCVTIGVPNDPKAVERFISEQEAKGAQVADIGKPQAYHPDQLHISLQFGGPDGLRAIGYVAQTFLAHCFPDLARDPAMKPFIDYTLKGIGKDSVWWDFDPPAGLPNAFNFGHRIIVGVDGERSVVYARFSLFSTLDFAMIFYDLTSNTASRSVVNDIDPMALKMPDDLIQKREEFAIAPVARPSDFTATLTEAITSGKARERHDQLMRRGEDHRRAGDAKTLLDKVQTAPDLSAKQNIVREFWEKGSQRILRLLVAALAESRDQNTIDNFVRSLVIDRLERATKRDETTPSGLAPSAEMAIKVAGAALSDAMNIALQSGTLDQDTTEMFIAGGKGMHAAAQAVLDKTAFST